MWYSNYPKVNDLGGARSDYLPGYGAYWYGAYPDERVVSKIDGTEWSYSDKMVMYRLIV